MAADLAVALQTLLHENLVLMAGLRPRYAQAASVKTPAEMLRNFPDAEKLSGDGGNLRCCQAILVQLITIQVRLQQCTESQGKQNDACGMLCPKGQAFVTGMLSRPVNSRRAPSALMMSLGHTLSNCWDG